VELYRTTLGAHVARLISCINSGTLDASDAEELFSPEPKPADGTPPFDETGRSDWVTSWASASPLELRSTKPLITCSSPHTGEGMGSGIVSGSGVKRADSGHLDVNRMSKM
jgi:hypothetical protein